MPPILAALAAALGADTSKAGIDPNYVYVEWIDDTGAGRHLCSEKHYAKVDVPGHILTNAIYRPSKSI